MTDREIMQQALEALEMYELETDSDTQRKAIKALRERLAQPEKRPVLQEIEQYRMQMAVISIAAMGYWMEGDDIDPDYDTTALRDVARLYAKYDVLYKAQPEQKPVPWESFFKRYCPWLAQPEQGPVTWVPPKMHPVMELRAQRGFRVYRIDDREKNT